MGAGGGELAAGQVFRIVVAFTNSGGRRSEPLGADERIYRNFVEALNAVIRRGEWQPDEDPEGKISGGTVLLRGRITADEASALNRNLNSVLKGLRMKQGGAPTSVAARVVKNIGPAAEGSTHHGPERGPDTSDEG